jgi:peptide/nickel transport system substrate-binding protein
MKRLNLLLSLLVIASVLAACGPTPEPQVVEIEVTKVITEKIVETVIVQGTSQTVEKEVTSVVEVEKVVTATPEPEKEPAVGGTMVVAMTQEPDSLDAHKSTLGVAHLVYQYIGATLVTKDLQTGEYIPYLAESWSVTDDGLTWDFTLKENIKFHDGTPLTAQDYAWTLQRVLDPETMSPVAQVLGGVTGVEAVDDYTLRIKMDAPSYPFLESLTAFSFQPLSQAYVEQMGEDYARQPMGVGPFKFKEWVTGDKVILERNPDFAWGPEFSRGGPSFIETIELRIIPEYATRMAGLEAGEIDYVGELDAKDVDGLSEMEQLYIGEVLHQGLNPFSPLNVTRPPFDDVRVRQAFNHAVDRDALIKVIEFGHAVPQYGPISPSVHGYWPGVEYIGYKYDLDKAKALMAEAGWTDSDGDGILDKDGQPLKLVMMTDPSKANRVKAAEILQDMYGALGAEIEIQLAEIGLRYAAVMSGDYDMTIESWGWAEAQLMYIMFHSDMLGAYNFSHLDNPELDQLLDATLTTMDHEKRQQWVDEAQRYIVEQAYLITLYTPMIFSAWSNRVMGTERSDVTGDVYLFDAYIVTE